MARMQPSPVRLLSTAVITSALIGVGLLVLASPASAQGIAPRHLFVSGFDGESPEVIFERPRPGFDARALARSVAERARFEVAPATDQAQERVAGAMAEALSSRALASDVTHGLTRRGPSLSAFKGLLPTPVPEGEHTGSFGPRRRDASHTHHRHTGWSWEVSPSTPIVAIGPGVVVFADGVDGLGGVVIVDHGEDIHSVYVGLTNVDVLLWQSVDPGSHLGRGGLLSAFGNEEIYFELRVRGIPENPAEWLAAGRASDP